MTQAWRVTAVAKREARTPMPRELRQDLRACAAGSSISWSEMSDPPRARRPSLLTIPDGDTHERKVCPQSGVTSPLYCLTASAPL